MDTGLPGGSAWPRPNHSPTSTSASSPATSIRTLVRHHLALQRGMAIKPRHRPLQGSSSATPCGGMTFSLTPIMMHPYGAVTPGRNRGQIRSPCTTYSPNRRKEHRSAHLSAGRTGTEAVGALGNLLGGDGDNVDGDGVELGRVSTWLEGCRSRKRTPKLLSRSFVSWSTSKEPDSLFWVKSRAEISGTY